MTAKTTQLDFFTTPQQAWDAMLADCAAAKTSIIFEQYIWEKNGIGKRFMDVMIDKAKQGVKIRLLLDRVGSRDLFESDEVAELRRHDAIVKFYNPISWLNIVTPNLWFPRNHAKVMTIDSHIVYIGSVCVADEMAQWRDLHLRITGEFTEEVETALNATKGTIRKKWLKSIGKKATTALTYRFALSLPKFLPNPIYRELRQQIRQAKYSIILASPYFLPPWRLRRALDRALRRGVKVTVMMGNQTDVPLADYVARSYFPRLLRMGIELYLYRPTVMHAKYVAIDDSWATVGSMNIDYLSLLHNREANVILHDSENVKALKKHFDSDLKDSVPATRKDWDDLPLHYKLMGRIGRIMKKVL